MDIHDIKQYIPKDVTIEIVNNIILFEVNSEEIKKITHNLYIKKNLPLKLITATDERDENGCFKIWYIFGVPKKNIFIVAFIKLIDTEEFPSITPVIHEAWNYEKKINTFFGLTPVGHPDLRMSILHENWPNDISPLRKDFNWQSRPKEANGVYKYEEIGGEGIYEIPVGPIHAGIIEPGHFRFSMAGEEIILLEPRLGFTHKGSEKLFEILSIKEKVSLSERISGDSSFSHSLAFCQAIEKLSEIEISNRASYLRVIYAELERLANHFGDIGAIMLDTGFNFGGAQGSRLREIIMQINDQLTQSRFLRGVNTIGGVTKDISLEDRDLLYKNLLKIVKDFYEVIEIAQNSTSLLNRLKRTGILSYEVAKDQGVVGVAAKAVGIQVDARVDFPYASYNEINTVKIETEDNGDVYARFNVRIKEANLSIKIIQEALEKLPEKEIKLPTDIVFKKNAIAISIVEGWRGDIVYFITTDSKGNINRVSVRDASFLNWPAVAFAAVGNIIADFPLINKSFNLSYSGNDL